MVARPKRRATPISHLPSTAEQAALSLSPRILGRVILAIDVGNTNMRVGLVIGGDVTTARQCRHARQQDRRTSDSNS